MTREQEQNSMKCIRILNDVGKKAGEALGKSSKTCSIPSLKRDDGSWAIKPEEKATVLANVFLGMYLTGETGK